MINMNLKYFRKAIILIHGFAGGNYDYGSLNNDLELYSNFDVFTFTLPGHEKIVINKVTRNDWINKAEEEIEKIINNGYHEIYIIGHSMGGVIAAHLASKYKEVTKLVLAAPAFHYLAFNGDKVDVAKSIKKLPKLFKNYKPEEVLSRFFKIPIPIKEKETINVSFIIYFIQSQ
jgi:carboxylesterase